MQPRLWCGSLIVAAAMGAGLDSPRRVAAQVAAGAQQPVAVPTTGEMERELYAALNAERASKGLAATRMMPELVDLARRHSTEMAARDVLSHDSETGTTYQQRLMAAGILSLGSGENVGRSGTFLTDLIHQSFMESPGHRQNILNPAFDAVGIGVVLGKRGVYFVTADFIRSFTLLPGSDIRTMMLRALNDARRRSRLPPVQLLDAVNAMADKQAQLKAEGREPPPVPIRTWRTSTRFVSGLDLDQIAASIRDQRVDGYGLAGIGSAFGRNRENPDGAYVVCVVLVYNGA